MFNIDDGEIWVHSVPHRPALDTVSAALFLLGVVLILIRYIRNRHWLDLFLLISIPLLLMPSILSLAFPGENPALNRAGGRLYSGLHYRGDGARWSAHQLRAWSDSKRPHVDLGRNPAICIRLSKL